MALIECRCGHLLSLGLNPNPQKIKYVREVEVAEIVERIQTQLREGGDMGDVLFAAFEFGLDSAYECPACKRLILRPRSGGRVDYVREE